jgi:hypothetical protein
MHYHGYKTQATFLCKDNKGREWYCYAYGQAEAKNRAALYFGCKAEDVDVRMVLE